MDYFSVSVMLLLNVTYLYYILLIHRFFGETEAKLRNIFKSAYER